MKIGYARVSRFEQNLDLQLDALKADGCEKIFTDKVSGAKDHKPGLEQALAFLRDHAEDTLVIWRLDRLGRKARELDELREEFENRGINLRTLTGYNFDTSTSGGKLVFRIIAAVAENERDQLIERTRAGLAAAFARGRKGGRKVKLDRKGIDQLRLLYNQTDGKGNRLHHRRDLCRTFGISEPTLYRYLKESGVSDQRSKHPTPSI